MRDDLTSANFVSIHASAREATIIRTLPAAPHDERIPDDIDTDFEDHALDAARYACMFKKREVFFGNSMG